MAKGDLIDTEANKQAGLALQRLRVRFGVRRRNRTRPLSQAKFAQLLAAEMGTGHVPSQTTLSDWEGAESVVPGPVLIAAATLLGKQLGRPVSIPELLGLEDTLRALFAAA